MDFWPGIDPLKAYMIATNQPYEKSANCKRVAFDVDIPDSLLFDVDIEAAGTTNVEELN